MLQKIKDFLLAVFAYFIAFIGIPAIFTSGISLAGKILLSGIWIISIMPMFIMTGMDKVEDVFKKK